MLLDGMHLPLTTPFHGDGRLNPRKLEDNIARYSKTPAAGLVVLGRSGQPSLLTDAETREVLRCAAGAAAAEKVLTAGVARDSVIATLELIEYAALHGYDVALVGAPSPQAALSAKEGLAYFQAVADRSPLPLVFASGGVGAVEMAVELAGHEKVIGMVDESQSAGRVERLVQATASVKRDVTVTMVFAAVTGRMLAKAGVGAGAAQFVSVEGLSGGTSVVSTAPAKAGLKTRTKRVGFQVLAGRTTGMLEALRAGAVGAMPPLSASVPQACYEVLAAWKDGDPALAEEKQERVRKLARRVEEELGMAGIKYGCDLTGYFGGRPRLPGLPLTGAERDEVEGLMQGMKN